MRNETVAPAIRLRRAVAGACVGMAMFAFLCLVGCRAPRPPLVITDPDPGVKIPAIKKAVRQRDKSAVTQLVKELESDDPAVRFYAIRALHRLTGEWFGYQYFDEEELRKPAVERWQKWLAGMEQNAEKTDVAGTDG